ncbi:hypothetical protein ACIA8G_30685 [Lentzea sp. NPDC051213]|uniref:hypothetical protein n=1 Tax=Lentzea sp. NPDC051213 TaxID=3364126 RepID=UPI0037ACB796
MRRLALLLLLSATLVGCGVIADLGALQNRLKDVGYTDITSYHESINGTDRVRVTASSADPASSAEEIAEILWDTYPEHVDQVSITLNGVTEGYTEDDLRAAFGDRQVTEKPDGDSDVGTVIITWVIVGVVVFLLFAGGLITLIVVLVRRSNRRRAQQPPYYPPPPPGWPAA